jgi:hypothetical protein
MSGQTEQKKAVLVDIDLKVRVIIGESIDPNMDEEFDEALLRAVKHRIKEEGRSFLTEGIQDFQDDIENPYNPEFDEKA